jgi:hypothetical protein
VAKTPQPPLVRYLPQSVGRHRQRVNPGSTASIPQGQIGEVANNRADQVDEDTSTTLQTIFWPKHPKDNQKSHSSRNSCPVRLPTGQSNSNRNNAEAVGGMTHLAGPFP